VTTTPPSHAQPEQPAVISAPLLSVVGSPIGSTAVPAVPSNDGTVLPSAVTPLASLAGASATPTDPTPGTAFCAVVGANGRVSIRTGQTTCTVSAAAGPGAYALGFGAGNGGAQPASATDPSTTADTTSAVPVVVGANGSLGIVNVPPSTSGALQSVAGSGAPSSDAASGQAALSAVSREVACLLKSPSTLRSQLAAGGSSDCQLAGGSSSQATNLLASLLGTTAGSSGSSGLSAISATNQSQLAAEIQQQIASLASELKASGASPAAEVVALGQLDQQIAADLQQAASSLGGASATTASIATLGGAGAPGLAGAPGSSAADGAGGIPGSSSVDAAALSGAHIEVSVDGSTVTCSLVGSNGVPITQVKGTGSQGCQLLEGAPGETAASLRSDLIAALDAASGSGGAQAATSATGPAQASSTSGSLAQALSREASSGVLTPVRVLAPA
jgi:HPt (histidine-containing phosphotransfer) domain-containing protein